MERQDPVLWGGRNDEPLSDDELRSFEENGFLIQERVFDEDETRRLLEEAGRLRTSATRGALDTITEPGNDYEVRSLFRLHRQNELVRSTCSDRRLAGVARQILASDVTVHQSRINFKPALDGKEFFWHSDFETWHVEDGMPRMRALSASVLLTESHEFNGPLLLVPGSHRTFVRCPSGTPDEHYKASLKKQEFGVPDREALAELIERGGLVAAKGPPGSVIFFDCNTMHGSAGNLSPYPRTNLFLVFNSTENPLQTPFGGHEPRPEFLAEREPFLV